jgi:CRP/FNR family cyclic AMP-dependent transcriptional regulator
MPTVLGETFAMMERKEVEATLAAGGWFASLPCEIQLAVLDAGAIRIAPPGKALFEQDGEPSGLHGILVGDVRVIGLSSEGNAFIMGIVRPGEWVGFLSCLDRLPHAYSGIARDGAQTFTLSPADVARIFERDVATYRLLQAPELAVGRKLGRYIIEDMGLPLAQRVAARLADLGRWPYGPSLGPVSALKNISQEELAMSVGATRPRINEILRDFAARGMIELGYGKIEVVNTTAVERFARDG